MDIRNKLETAKQWLFAIVRNVIGIELDKERRKENRKPFSQRLKAEYERRHGEGSMWFSGRTQRQENETLEAFTARRYAEAIAGIHAALDAREAMNAYMRRNRWRAVRAGAALGATYGIMYAHGALGVGWAAAAATVWIFIWAIAALWGGTDERFVAVMTEKPLSKEAERDAAQHVGETLVRVPAADAPADLRDLYRLPFVDTEGRPLSERVIETDLIEDYFAIEANNLAEKTFNRTLMYLFGGQMLGAILAATALTWALSDDTLKGMAGNLASTLGVVGLVTGMMTIGAFLLICNWGTPLNGIDRRIRNLEAIAEKSIDQMAQQCGVAAALVQDERALVDQIENAKADKTPFFELGKSSGFLRQRYDVFAPSVAGMPFGLSFNDLATHLIVLGGTGSGKTSGTIRPLVRQWLGHGQGGLLVLDGKGQLPAEINHADYKLISPKTTTINPIEGLTPDDVAETLADLAGSDENQSDPYWPNAAAKLVRSAAHVVKALADAGHGAYNLAAIYNVVESGEEKESARQIVTREKLMDGLNGAAKRGLHYCLVEFPKKPEKERGSIQGIASLWLSQITDNEKMEAWADADTGFEIEAVCRGAQIGVVLPESEYGKAGVLASGLLKKRVYEAIKRRGDTWQDVEGETPVLVVIDEVQALLTDDETAMLPIARSLGLYAAFSTQNVDGILSKLGDHAGYQLLGNLRSMVAYQTQTKKTTEYISERMGATYRPQIQHAARYEDLGARLIKVAHDAVGHTGDRQRGLRPAMRTAGMNVAQLGHDVMDFVLHPQKRIKDNQEVGSENQWFIQSAIEHNASIAAAENIDGHGSMEQTLALSRVVDPDEVNEVLSQPNTALAQVIRGRVVRRDLIGAKPIYNMLDAGAKVTVEVNQDNQEAIEGELA